MNNIEHLIKSGMATIIDVRTPEEFKVGHVRGSINIPLSEVDKKLNQLKTMQNIVLCCASGARSRNASFILENNGIKCNDVGSWKNIQNLT